MIENVSDNLFCHFYVFLASEPLYVLETVLCDLLAWIIMNQSVFS